MGSGFQSSAGYRAARRVGRFLFSYRDSIGLMTKMEVEIHF